MMGGGGVVVELLLAEERSLGGTQRTRERLGRLPLEVLKLPFEEVRFVVVHYKGIQVPIVSSGPMRINIHQEFDRWTMQERLASSIWLEAATRGIGYDGVDGEKRWGREPHDAARSAEVLWLRRKKIKFTAFGRGERAIPHLHTSCKEGLGARQRSAIVATMRQTSVFWRHPHAASRASSPSRHPRLSMVPSCLELPSPIPYKYIRQRISRFRVERGISKGNVE